jgi:predicted HicB family RNase H-like nuclease
MFHKTDNPKKEFIGLRVTDELKEKVWIDARENKKSMSERIIEILNNHYDSPVS